MSNLVVTHIYMISSSYIISSFNYRPFAKTSTSGIFALKPSSNHNSCFSLYHIIAHLLESEDGSESALSRQHVLNSIADLVEWELLNHALDILVLSKLDSLLAVEGVTRWPTVDGSAFHDQSDGVDWDLADSCLRSV